MPMERDYYSVLQVNRAASQETIEAAYRRLARIYDPTVSKKPKAALRMREIDEAYAVLSDRKRRAEYDRMRGSQRGKGGALSSAGRAATGPISAFLAWTYAWPVVGAAAVGVLLLAAVLIAMFGGGGGGSAVSNQTPGAQSPAAQSPGASPVGQTPAPSEGPPPVSGEEITLPSGLKYVDIKEGTGESPQYDQTVVVRYTGWLASNGEVFDTTEDDGKPAEFLYGPGLIQGWNLGLADMKVGGKRRLIVPPALAYKEQGTPGGLIPPNATLIFDIELLQATFGPTGTATPTGGSNGQ